MTLSILNLGDSVAVDVSEILAPPRSDFRLVSMGEDNREAVYQKISGDSEYPMTVRVGHYPDAKKNAGVGQTNISLKISTFVRKTDADLDVVWTLPCTATLAVSMPGLSGVPDTDGVQELLSNLLIWVLPVVGGAQSTDGLDELKFGVVGGLVDYADSGTV